MPCPLVPTFIANLTRGEIVPVYLTLCDVSGPLSTSHPPSFDIYDDSGDLTEGLSCVSGYNQVGDVVQAFVVFDTTNSLLSGPQYTVVARVYIANEDAPSGYDEYNPSALVRITEVANIVSGRVVTMNAGNVRPIEFRECSGQGQLTFTAAPTVQVWQAGALLATVTLTEYTAGYASEIAATMEFDTETYGPGCYTLVAILPVIDNSGNALARTYLRAARVGVFAQA